MCHGCPGRSHLLEHLLFHLNKLSVNFHVQLSAHVKPRTADLSGEVGDLLASPYDTVEQGVLMGAS